LEIKDSAGGTVSVTGTTTVSITDGNTVFTDLRFLPGKYNVVLGFQNGSVEWKSKELLEIKAGNNDFNLAMHFDKIVADVTYTVSFNSNGGTGKVPDSITVNAGEELTLPGRENMTKANSTFTGWQTKTGDATAEDFLKQGDKYKPTSSTTLYARWVATESIDPISITITGFESNGTANLYIRDAAGAGVYDPNNAGVQATGGSAAFTDLRFLPGSYRIVVSFFSGTETEWRSKELLEIKAGSNSFALATDFAKVEPTVISVTGITDPDAARANITIWQGREKVAEGWAYQIQGGNANFTLKASDSQFMFTGGGSAEIILQLRNESHDDLGFYHTSMTLNAGTTNTIPFNTFTEMPPLEITVTGIPDKYTHGSIALLFPGKTEAAGYVDGASLTIPNSTFTIKNVPAGTYDVLFLLMNQDGVVEFHKLASRNITKNTTLQFSAFTVMPTTTVTVSGLESLNGLQVRLGVFESGSYLANGFGTINGGKVVFTLFDDSSLPLNPSGSFQLILKVGSEELTVTKTITAEQDNKFTFADFGGKPLIVIAVTDLPNSSEGNAKIRVLNGSAEVASGSADSLWNNEAVFVLKANSGEFFNTPGTYSLELEFFRYNGDVHSKYSLASKPLVSGANTIPLTTFTKE